MERTNISNRILAYADIFDQENYSLDDLYLFLFRFWRAYHFANPAALSGELIVRHFSPPYVTTLEDGNIHIFLISSIFFEVDPK